ncbi:MAG: TonB-dependent receptor [Terriglobales bacterium]|jgi:hypothetical protein
MARLKPPALAGLLLLLLATPPAFANDYGAVRGVVHDPQHRPIQDAMVMPRAKSSEWAKSVTTDSAGQFQLNAVPRGEYWISIASQGFRQTAQQVIVISGSVPVVHFQLQVASANEKVFVSDTAAAVATDSFTPTTLVSRFDIERTPGADATNSMSMITDYVPGAYVTHDMLHMRGGHQITWLLDGIPVVNTAIAQNLGPQFDPKDLDYVEVNRGSYSSEFGDRTYGAFNVVPRSGFERNNQAELTVTAGNFYQTDDALSFGSHTDRFAYYGSVNANRSNLGLQPPVPQVVHDAVNGAGGFGSFIFNVDGSNQLRLMTSVRRDYYQIPYDPNPDDFENSNPAGYPSIGLRDGQRETDTGVLFTWLHTFDSHLLTTVSPFFHDNRGDYASNPGDVPVATTEDRASTYVGGQASFAANYGKNDLQVGFLGFYQHDRQQFDVIPGLTVPDTESPTANLEAFYIDDKFKPFSWLMLSAGMRPTRFSEGNFSADSIEPPIAESAISPRFGATVTIPKLGWTFRAFYGHYYQAPPIETVSGPLITQCQPPNCEFLPLHGERDEEHQFGVTLPYRGWVLDADTFKTDVANFLDHNNIGASNIFFPLTDARALIRGWELTVRSPPIAHRAQLHLAYSNQIAEGGGVITGGLNNTDACPSNPNGTVAYLCPLDHDQRNTLNLGGNITLPRRSYASTNVYYGSGFTNGQEGVPGWPYPGAYLPGHTTFDVSLAKISASA